MNTTPATAPQAPRACWTDADLEAFVDGALADPASGALAADLREDPALRARLAAVTRVNALARDVLLAPDTDRPARRRRAPLVPSFAAAAALALVASLIVLRMIPATPAPGGDPAAHPPAAADWGTSIRVVIAIPARARTTSGHRAAATPAPLPSPPGRALAARAADVPTDLLASDNPADRARVYRALGEVLRSAAAANAALDALPPAEQLEACRLWADDPRLRPVVFPRLRTLADHPDLTDELAIVLADLKDRPDLRGWLASHDLLAAAAKPAHAADTSG